MAAACKRASPLWSWRTCLIKRLSGSFLRSRLTISCLNAVVFHTRPSIGLGFLYDGDVFSPVCRKAAFSLVSITAGAGSHPVPLPSWLVAGLLFRLFNTFVPSPAGIGRNLTGWDLPAFRSFLSTFWVQAIRNNTEII